MKIVPTLTPDHKMFKAYKTYVAECLKRANNDPNKVAKLVSSLKETQPEVYKEMFQNASHYRAPLQIDPKTQEELRSFLARGAYTQTKK